VAESHLLFTVHIEAVALVAPPAARVLTRREPIEPPDVLNDYARRLIQYKARRLDRHTADPFEDHHDLEQELALHLLRMAKHFEPARGSLSTFVARVVDSRIASLMRMKRRLKRGRGTATQSLDETSESCKSPLAAEVSCDDAERRLGAASADELTRHIDAEAFASAISRCDPQVQELYHSLGSETVASVARRLGLSRHKRRALLEANKAHFQRAGFGNSQK
jgi:RNA polymerase sigma-70 factor (ECF subfamily)